jgi:hypothetical protein
VHGHQPFQLSSRRRFDPLALLHARRPIEHNPLDARKAFQQQGQIRVQEHFLRAIALRQNGASLAPHAESQCIVQFKTRKKSVGVAAARACDGALLEQSEESVFHRSVASGTIHASITAVYCVLYGQYAIPPLCLQRAVELSYRGRTCWSTASAK